MRVLVILLLWGILLAVCWPLALLVFVVWPFLWLLTLPLRLLFVVVEAAFAFIRAVLFLPARILGRW
ncbi:MAG TPA: hypothetical protein VLH60_01030 [Sedimentisphaerales bacterium]|nr:hypothetical protein [Sedimentisphaerales bacterium]